MLFFFGKASKEDEAFYKKHQSRTMKQANAPLEGAHWEKLRYRGKSRLFDAFMARLAPFAIEAMSFNHKELGLHKRKDVYDPTEKTPVNTVLDYVSGQLNYSRPQCFVDPQKRAGINVLNLSPPALALGLAIEGAHAGARLHGRETVGTLISLQHVVARFLRIMTKGKRLKTSVSTVMKLINPSADVAADEDLDDVEDLEALRNSHKMGRDSQTHLDVSN